MSIARQLGRARLVYWKPPMPTVHAGTQLRWYEELCRIKIIKLREVANSKGNRLTRTRLPARGGVYCFWWTGNLTTLQSPSCNMRLELVGPGGRPVLLELISWGVPAYPHPYPQTKISRTRRSATDAKKPLCFSGLQVSAAFSSAHWKVSGGADGTRTRDPRRDRPVF